VHPYFNRLGSRRSFLLASAGLALATSLRPALAPAADIHDYRISAGAARASLIGGKYPETDVWAYNGAVPGPTLRVRQGEPVRIAVENRLDQDTTVHGHGIRLRNAMDGVPGLTQPPIRPGENFTYEFTPPDAGTFWYHSHASSVEQLGRGLAGALIVEEPAPVAVDRDPVWMLTDWRLTPDGALASSFGNSMEAAMSGHIGNVVTLNGAASGDQAVKAGERLRLQRHVDDRRRAGGYAAVADAQARSQRAARHSQRHRMVAPDASARPQLPRAQPQQLASAASPMAGHRPAGAQRCREMRLCRRQSWRLDAALSRHEPPGFRPDDCAARRLNLGEPKKRKLK
jgi:Multicopper oxidase